MIKLELAFNPFLNNGVWERVTGFNLCTGEQIKDFNVKQPKAAKDDLNEFAKNFAALNINAKTGKV